MKIKKVLVTLAMVVLIGCIDSCYCNDIVVEEAGSDDTVTGKIQGQVTQFQKYVKLFEHSRALQIDAVKSILKMNVKYESKYQLVETMLTKIFQVIEGGKTNLTEWGFMPGDDWPEKVNVREAASNVVENVALFGDLVLRLPDMTHDIYDKNKEWEFLIGWGVWFAMESNVFQGKHAKMLNLMSQEIGLIPKEDNYINPYKEESAIQDLDELQKVLEEKKKQEKAEKLKKKSKETKAKRKGPRLSGTSHTEL